MPHLTVSKFIKRLGRFLEEIQYLVTVISTKTKRATFDVPRFENYIREKASLISLPLASNPMTGHL